MRKRNLTHSACMLSPGMELGGAFRKAQRGPFVLQARKLGPRARAPCPGVTRQGWAKGVPSACRSVTQSV